jgi:gamma-glutamylcyclotransferase (GGCT)/AIG2-like uncharacterized protein YtfP
MRPIYRRRRDALLASLARHLPELRTSGASAGLHVLAILPGDLDEAIVVDRAAAAGIALSGLTPRRIAPGPAGLVFGYGAITESAIDEGIRRLAVVIEACRGAATAGRAATAASAEPIVLAVYGTLRRGQANEGFLAGATHLGSGRIRGRLHEMPRSDLRAYAFPALLEDSGGQVAVELYALRDAAMLATVDALEAFDPADETGSQYVRREIAVAGAATRTAWVYRYNGPLDEVGDLIPDGDWVAHLRRR